MGQALLLPNATNAVVVMLDESGSRSAKAAVATKDEAHS